MEINSLQLLNELVAAGIKCCGCNSDGVVWALDCKTEIQNDAKVKAVLQAHVPAEELNETLEEKIGRIVDEKLAQL